MNRREFLKTTAVAAAALAVVPRTTVGKVAGKNNSLLEPSASAPLGSITEVKYPNATTGGPCWVYVSNGKIVRTEAMWFPPDEAKAGKYGWQIPVKGKIYSPDMHMGNVSWGTGARSWIYTPTRGKYPMKRVDWDPSGNRNPQNRGKSGYVRISWDDAMNLVAAETQRIITTYGNSAIYGKSSYHMEWGGLSGREAGRWRNAIGGLTGNMMIPNSWEGWCYGASFMWGYYWLNGIVTARDALVDTMQNSDRIVFWGTDPLTVIAAYGGQQLAKPYTWWKDMGKKIIAVNPQLAWSMVYADKWIPVIPGTDTALAMAIAYVWIQEGTYDKNYVDTHVIGFDEKTLPAGVPANAAFKYYILGQQDGVPKTPEWAEPITGVKARDIRALAREWASSPTSVVPSYSGACRTAYDYEWARMMVALVAMQGLGKPGVNSWSTATGIPRDWRDMGIISYSDGPIDKVAVKKLSNPVPQRITEGFVDQCVLGPFPATWTGGNSLGGSVEPAFQKWTFPMTGYSKIHMWQQHGSSCLHYAADLGKYIKIWQDPSIEFFVLQAPWFESDALYCDIFLPVATHFETDDLTESGKLSFDDTATSEMRTQMRIAVYQAHVIDPLWESKGDYEIYCDWAQRLDKLRGGSSSVYNDFTDGGKTRQDWLKAFWDWSMANKGNIPMTWDQFKAKGYYVFPWHDDYYTNPDSGYSPTLRWFYNKQILKPADGLSTPTGKIEFFSTRLYQQYGLEDAKAGCGAIPKWRPSWEGRDTHPLVDTFPLQLLTSHPRFRYHGKFHQVAWLRDLWRVTGPGGYQYEPMHINPVDAKNYGLKNGDIVRVWNNRGQILASTVITNKIIPGAIQISYGAWPDLAQTATYGSLDKAGNSNFLTPLRPPPGIQDHSCNQAWNSVLVQIQKWVT